MAGLNRGVRSGAPLPRKTELPVAGNRGVRIRLPRRGSVVVRGFAIRRCERIHRAFSWLVLTGDRGFESISLQRGGQAVDAVAIACERKWGIGRIEFLVDAELRARFSHSRPGTEGSNPASSTGES